MNKQALLERFITEFGTGETRIYHSPGRINLIGEHTDYNGGYVFPCALSIGTYACAKKRTDGKVHFASVDMLERLLAEPSGFTYYKMDGWLNYAKGVVVAFQNKGFAIGGFDILFSGNIPNGAGLSSSASLTLCLSVAINDLFDCKLDMLTMVHMCRWVENSFVGVNCGIMDQFAVGMSKKDHAIFLNCRDLSYQYVPLVLGDAKIVIANTNKRRELADSKYNERRSECEQALVSLQKHLPVSSLGEISEAQFAEFSHCIENETLLKRAKHIIEENARTQKAVVCLNENNLTQFGQYMVQSHESLRDLYEVTGRELDTLVEEALKIPGVYGARMTGAGFGGCSISIVKNAEIESFIQQVGAAYTIKTGLTADFYIADPADGAKRVYESDSDFD